MASHLALSLLMINSNVNNIHSLKEKCATKDLKIKELETNFVNNIESLKKKCATKDLEIKELKKNFAEINANVDEMKNKMVKEYTWIIKDVTVGVRVGTMTRFSDCFSFAGSYKFKIRADIPRNEYLCLALSPEQGQFDPFLEWPINVHMTLILVHPFNNDRSVIKEGNWSVESPTSNRIGFNRFIALDNIEQYIADDKFCVKCILKLIKCQD